LDFDRIIGSSGLIFLNQNDIVLVKKISISYNQVFDRILPGRRIPDRPAGPDWVKKYGTNYQAAEHIDHRVRNVSALLKKGYVAFENQDLHNVQCTPLS
jgi:hypothetical protein